MRIIALKGQKTIFDLADEYGVHYQTISRIQNHGFAADTKFTYYFPEDDAKLLELEAAGLSRKEMAARMGRTMGSIDGRLQALRRQRKIA